MENQIDGPLPVKKYFALEVTTTQKCDMACTYCFEGEELKNPKKQDLDIIKIINDLLTDTEFRKEYNGITLDFWGGEPTLNTKLIFEVLEAYKDEPIDFFFYTNGLNALTISSIIYKFREYGIADSRFSFQVSYDGIGHDKYRVDHSGKGTQKRVLASIKYLSVTFPEINFSIKGTLPVEELTNIVEHWEHYYELSKELPWIAWSPTIEYTNKYLIEQNMLDKLKKDFTELAKREIKYFEENGRFLFTWFGTGDRAMCTAGINIANIDLDGNMLVCHGALYVDKKDEFIIGNVDNIGESVMTSHKKHKEMLILPEHCKGCTATVCYQCPIINVEVSDKKYEDAFHDPKDDLCEVYKLFGLIDRTVQRYLKLRN